MDVIGKSYKNQGITLIELMIAVVIVGILAAIGYPSYTQQVQKSERKKAAAEVLSVAARMERIKSLRFQYPVPAPGDIVSSAKLRYSISVTSTDGVAYVITADPSSSSAQANDSCGVMTLNQIGEWTFANSLTENDCL